MKTLHRRRFVSQAMTGVALPGMAARQTPPPGPQPGDRPDRPAGLTILNPCGRVPVSLIIDDSTCLVNLNRFAMPQFDLAHGGKNPAYLRNWREWPAEIPDSFVSRFGEWCAEQGVKGKFSVVPYPACVGRLDRLLPGWSPSELDASLELVRTLLAPNWDFHPEMITHTRVIDLKTGHPYPETSLNFMENWEWTTGKSADEIGAYLRYALSILKNVGLRCEGVTSPGGFGSRARPELARAVGQAVRDIFAAEIPHYFLDLVDRGTAAVTPRVELASGLESADPRCVVSIVGCTSDWTGGWDNTTPGGADRFITADLQQGRLVEVIGRKEPAVMVCHWTGIYWNGQELGFHIFQEVVRRLGSRYDHLIWMKLSEIARYWAARELTRMERETGAVVFRAPYACPDFTMQWEGETPGGLRLRHQDQTLPLKRVSAPLLLRSGAWIAEGRQSTACFDLPKGISRLEFAEA